MPAHRKPALTQTLHLLSAAFLLSAALHVTAQDSRSSDCHFSAGDSTYDLSELGGPKVLSRTMETPPSTQEDELRFDLCADLTELENRASEDQCSLGTRACLTTINHKKGSTDRIMTVVPIATSSLLDVRSSALTSPEGIAIILHGPPSNSVPQSLKILLTCAEGTTDPQFSSYEDGQVLVEWSSSAACRTTGTPKEDESRGGDDGSKEENRPIESVGSGLGFFFLMLFLTFAAYLTLGAYYNYSTYGARGWDLIPHRDFWREVPYMLQDVIAHLCSNVRMRRSSRGGYIAV
ncbi:autophagy-related protein 27 [Boletus edulis]|nr:autophagy-related protein 27 [Boletus edulis]